MANSDGAALQGTKPKGSVWKMNPVPECCPGASDTEAGACEKQGYTCGSYEHTDLGRKCGAHTCGHDSGLGASVPAFPWPTDDPSAPPAGVEPKFSIVDKLKIPADLKKGHWILGCPHTHTHHPRARKLLEPFSPLVHSQACSRLTRCLAIQVAMGL